MARTDHNPDGVPGTITAELDGYECPSALDEEALDLYELHRRSSSDPGSSILEDSDISPSAQHGTNFKKPRDSLLQVRSNLEEKRSSSGKGTHSNHNSIARLSLNSGVSMTASQNFDSRQRRGAARRSSHQRSSARTVESKRQSGLSHRRFNSILGSHCEMGALDDESEEGNTAFRERMKSEFNALGVRLAAEHEAALSVAILRSEWFERELGLIKWELDRMCMEQGMPIAQSPSCPQHLSIQHLKTSTAPAMPRKPALKGRKASSQLSGPSYADLMKRGSVLSAADAGKRGSLMSTRSSLQSEFYISDALEADDGTAPDKRFSILSLPPTSDVVRPVEGNQDRQNSEDLSKVSPPPPLEQHPPPPIAEEDCKLTGHMHMHDRGSIETVEPLPQAVEPPVVTLNAEKIISVSLPPEKPDARGSLGSLTSNGEHNSASTYTSNGSSKPHTGLNVPLSAQLTIPGGKSAARVSWLEDPNMGSATDFGQRSSTVDSQDVEPEVPYPLHKVWADKVNRIRPSARGSTRSRGSDSRRASATFVGLGTRRDDEALDSDSDEDQILIEKRNRITNSSRFGDAPIQSPSGLSALSSIQRTSVEQKMHDRRWQIRMRRLVVDPESHLRTIFDLIGALLVAYESVAIPIQFFVEPTMLMTTMEWTVRIFWTMELCLSLFTTYTRSNGKLELRIQRVMKRYLLTWFPFDLLMVVLDWAELVLLDYDGLLVFGRIVRSIRLVRTVRILRFAKLHRVPEVVKAVAYSFRSDMCLIIMSIVRLIFFVIWINHFVCCCWYAIGIQKNRKGTWVTTLGFDKDTLWYQYWTSFHWSLAQFAAGSVEVMPCNMFERIYAVVALLFAYVVSAWIVSSITSSMTRLEIAAAQETEKMMTLKQYLLDNHISVQVALRVQRNAQFALHEKSRKRDESAVELLSLISEPLRMDVHFEMNSKWLCFHPLFRNYCSVSPGLMRQVCHQALSRLDLQKGDMLFTDDEPCVSPSMYFILNGKFSFLHGLAHQPRGVGVGHWACEATLWTEWVHCGDMRAVADVSTLLVLDAGLFQMIVSSSENQWMPCYKYGIKFVNHLNITEEEHLTDLEDMDMDLESWAAEACPDAQREQPAVVRHLSLKRSQRPQRLSNLMAKGS